MTEQLTAKWDAFYRESDSDCHPVHVLRQHMYLLPRKGQCLDLACGLGANSIFLAELGLSVDAWDISQVALKKLQHKADLQGFLPIQCRKVYIQANSLPRNQYDVIVVSRFFDRSLSDAIIGALKPGGILFYQTYTREKLDPNGPTNTDYLLKRNELLRLFNPLTVVYYQEFANLGDLNFANRNEAMLIAQKPHLELNS
mgnify:CR=1 FL=1